MITSMEEPRPASQPDSPASPLSRPLRAEQERECQGLPATPAQCFWARSRPAPHRVAAPAAGDTMLMRLDKWADPIPARVIWVQPDDDVDDPHVCQVQVDPATGRPMLLEGRPVFVTNSDPWFKVKVAIELNGGIAHTVTREARLPGSEGWLPLDWEDRFRPMPWEV